MPCVGALATAPDLLITEGGELKDVQRFYERLAERLFGLTGSCAYFQTDPKTLRSVTTVIAEGKPRLTILRSGNLLRITDDRGRQYEHRIWEDEYVELGMY